MGGNKMSGCPFKNLFSNEKGAFTFFKKQTNPHFQENSNVSQSRSTSNSTFVSIKNGKESNIIKFLNFSDTDINNLVKIRPIIESNASEIVEVFYRNLQMMPHLMNIIDNHSTIEKLKQTLKQYLIEMVSGDIGEQYVIRRKVIGNVHNRIGLFPEWYIGAYTIIQNEVLNVLNREIDQQDEIIEIFQSFQRLCSFDMQIAVKTYIESYTSSMMKLNEIEELQFRLNDSSTNLASSAEETTSSISDKEAVVEQMLSEINSIQHSSKKMIAEAENGKLDVSEALTKVDEVVELIETTKGLTLELSNSSKEIGEVVKAIRGISNQTNILSLNAGIEAARAGEHGKGFTIVAQEVRKLAGKTEEALDLIQNQISNVQSTIDKFENSFTHIVEETGVFGEINRNIIQILEHSVENVKSSDQSISHLSEFVADFKYTFKEITDASYQIAEMAEQLRYLNNELTEKVKN